MGLVFTSSGDLDGTRTTIEDGLKQPLEEDVKSKIGKRKDTLEFGEYQDTLEKLMRKF
jgi:hypothetical protein